MKIGIVGLPNVGKSTLFSAITNSEAMIANYPFATIEPNIGVVELKDERVDFLGKAHQTKKYIYNQITFVDIAGLVKGASKGEGLGNKFLANIREVDAIVHVVRLFENSDIVHVDNNVDPVRDANTINLELIIADLEQLTKWLFNNEKKVDMRGTTDEKSQIAAVRKAVEILKSEKKLSTHHWNKEDRGYLRPFSLLTLKPTIYMGNIAEAEIADAIKNKHHDAFVEFVKHNNEQYCFVSTQIEYEISRLDNESQKVFLEELGLKESGLTALSKLAFKMLGLKSFFTSGVQETRAWIFYDGMTAPQAAGVIHTDFEKGFIKAEVYAFEDFKKYPSEAQLKEKGLLRLEGKDYIMKDGDVCHFRFNV